MRAQHNLDAAGKHAHAPEQLADTVPAMSFAKFELEAAALAKFFINHAFIFSCKCNAKSQPQPSSG